MELWRCRGLVGLGRADGRLRRGGEGRDRDVDGALLELIGKLAFNWGEMGRFRDGGWTGWEDEGRGICRDNGIVKRFFFCMQCGGSLCCVNGIVRGC